MYQIDKKGKVAYMGTVAAPILFYLLINGNLEINAISRQLLCLLVSLVLDLKTISEIDLYGRSFINESSTS